MTRVRNDRRKPLTWQRKLLARATKVRKHDRFAIIAIATLGTFVSTAIVLRATGVYGPAVSPDSVAFLTTSKHIAAGKGMINYDGTLYYQWPPLFPLLLALVQAIFGIAAITAARITNALLFGMIVAIATIWMGRRTRSSIVLLTVTATLALSHALLFISVAVWTEPLYSVAVLVAMLGLSLHASRIDRRWLLIAAVAAGAAGLTRYTGPPVIAAGVCALLLNTARPWKMRFREAIIYGGISFGMSMLWVLRNLMEVGAVGPSPPPSGIGPFQNIRTAGKTIVNWVTPHSEAVLQYACFAAVVGGGIAAIWYVTKRRIAADLIPLLCFIVVYPSMIIYATSTVGVDAITNRYMAPMAAPLILLSAIGVLSIQSMIESRTKRPAYRALPFTVFMLWISFIAIPAISHAVTQYRKYGTGYYSTAVWETSNMIEYLRLHPPQGHIVSNFPDAIVYLDHIAAKPAPAKYAYGSTKRRLNELPRFEKLAEADGGIFVILFEGMGRDYYYTMDELTTLYPGEFRPIRTEADAKMYLWKH